MKKIVIYQKATCGTCRKEKDYLSKVKISFDEINIVKNPPTREFLERNIDEGNLKAYVNKHSKPYRELNLAKKKLTKSELIDLMLQDPNLIKRHILVDGGRVFFGYTEL
ncbi:MAG: Spx/MgsR family RNA polymerase-binding regulatory protein [Bacteroidetes bacterium]|nr:Spx/MgsR family RNA polymerase-binding regulatory protein [Bacteroidota bacterium]MCL5034374.1 Spx/MgsR family RNA polymerase-binding regulatory protein [Bacteroidota bacterium]